MKQYLLLLVTIIGLPLFAKGNIEKVYTNAEANNYLFPLDSEGKMHLLVEVPDHFKYAHYDGQPSQITLHFIPKNDKLKKWSEIITVWVLPPTDHFEKTVEALIEDLSVSSSFHPIFSNKEEVKTIHFTYESSDSRGKQQSKEAYHWKGYHGEDAIYIVHYGFRYDRGISSKNHTKLEKKASSFISNLKIVKS